jgi:hypothetical protein
LPLAVVNQTDEGTMDVASFVVHFGRLGMAAIRLTAADETHADLDTLELAAISGCNQWLQP